MVKGTGLGAQVTAAQVVGDVVGLCGFFGLIAVFRIVAAHDNAVLFVFMVIELDVEILQQVQVDHEFHFFHRMDEFPVVHQQVSLLAVGEGLEEGWCQHVYQFRLC